MRKLQVLTNSELESFDACRALHGYTYHELLRPKRQAAPLTLGTLGHAGIAAGWTAASTGALLTAYPDDRVFAAQVASEHAIDALALRTHIELESDGADLERLEKLEECRQAAQFGAKHYFAQRVEDFISDCVIPIAIEQPFAVVLPTAKGFPSIIEYSGVMDLVLFDRESNSLRIEDHKFTTFNPTALERKIALSTQLTGYLVALRQILRENCDSKFLDGAFTRSRHFPQDQSFDFMRASTGRIAYNVIKAISPKSPEINKNGLVSCRPIDTLPEYYQQALFLQETERQKPVTSEQMELLAKIKAKACWFKQVEFFRGDDEIARWRAEVEVKAREIRASARHPELRVRNSGHCSGSMSYACSMAIVCMDPHSEATRKNSYRVASSRHEEVEQAKDGIEETGNEFGF